MDSHCSLGAVCPMDTVSLGQLPAPCPLGHTRSCSCVRACRSCCCVRSSADVEALPSSAFFLCSPEVSSLPSRVVRAVLLLGVPGDSLFPGLFQCLQEASCVPGSRQLLKAGRAESSPVCSGFRSLSHHISFSGSDRPASLPPSKDPCDGLGSTKTSRKVSSSQEP